MSRRIARVAPAKVNLTLEVLGRRADGYHELVSVFAAIDLVDEVGVAVARTLDVRLSPDPGAPPNDDLCARAVRALAAATGREPRAAVRVRKRIPVAAGLGGGSSDAGATLRALVDLWRVEADLPAIGATVGSDVPFFAAGAALALVRGRGERIETIAPPAAPLWLALVRPAARLTTATVFAGLGQTERSDGSASAGLRAALESPTPDLGLVRSLLVNDLTAAAERACPPITEARAAGAALGIVLHLSGSGPTLFALCDDRADAIRVARRLKRAGLRATPHAVAVPYR